MYAQSSEIIPEKQNVSKLVNTFQHLAHTYANSYCFVQFVVDDSVKDRPFCFIPNHPRWRRPFDMCHRFNDITELKISSVLETLLLDHQKS